MPMLATSKTDTQIMDDVLRKLRWDNRVEDADVGIRVEDGLVTLTGHVSSYAAKLAAQEAAFRVGGVTAIANDIDVRQLKTDRPSDTSIAQRVHDALEWDVYVPHERIEATVTDGWVKLNGEVDNWTERADAERPVRYLWGVKGVTNTIKVSPKVSTVGVKEAIEDALERRVDREAAGVKVSATDGRVTLSGPVYGSTGRRSSRRQSMRPG
jgi:osmotically-inducible protein OsmY